MIKRFIIKTVIIFFAAWIAADSLGRAYSQSINSKELKEKPFESALTGNNRKKAEDAAKKGFEYLAKGLIGDARNYFLKAIKIDESYYKPYLELGLLYRWEEIDFLSIPYLEKAGELLHLSLERRDYGNYGAMIADQRRAVRLLAGAYLSENRKKEAKKLLEKLVTETRNPSDFGQLAWLLFKENNLDESEKVAKKGVKISSANLPSRNTLAVVESHRRNFREAMKHYNALSFQDQMSSVVLNNSGETQLALFNYKEAEGRFLQALYKFKRHDTALTHINLANIYLNSLHISRAIDILKGYTGSRDWGFYVLARVRALYMKGDLKGAKILLDEAGRLRQTYGHIGWGITNFDFFYSYWSSRIYDALAIGIKNSESLSVINDARLFFLELRYSFLAWWYKGKAKRVVAGSNKMQEDFFIHASDSIYNYSDLGIFLADFPYKEMEDRLLKLMSSDKRAEAEVFYLSWLAELEWQNNNRIYGYIYMYRALEKIDKNKFPLLYLSLLRQKSIFGRDKIAGLNLFAVLPSYAFFSEIKLPARLSVYENSGKDRPALDNKRSRVILGQSGFFRNAKEDEYALEIIVRKNRENGYRVRVINQIFDREKEYTMTIESGNLDRSLRAVIYRIALEVYSLKLPRF